MDNYHDTTIPWSDDELVKVDGVPLVYTFRREPESEGQMIVRLPGRGSATLAELRAAGCTIVLPKFPRTTDVVRHAARR